jgi:hypothetical protein
MNIEYYYKSYIKRDVTETGEKRILCPLFLIISLLDEKESGSFSESERSSRDTVAIED